MNTSAYSPRKALRWFGFKQVVRGSVILGLLAGFMLTLQGVAYQKTYSTSVAQAKFAKSLAAAPGLGFLYGDPKNLDKGTAGYMVYRVLGFMGVVTAIWALMTITKLLRGNEEDGRWEVIRSGGVTARQATIGPLWGFAGAWCLAVVISLLMTFSATSSAGIHISAYAVLLLNLAIFIPALLFAGMGVLTSQLGLTRQRALLYGLLPLAILFLLRGVANSVSTLHWLKVWTPFGWAELVNPVLAPQPWWLLPFVVLGALSVVWGVSYTRRDLGSSVISQSEVVLPRFALLGTPWKLALRQNMWTFGAWAFGALLVVGLIAALTTTAINATVDSGKLSRSVHTLAGHQGSLKLAFLGAGMVFLAMVLLNFAIHIIGEIRRDEAKQYLDTILVSPVRRTSWLLSRLVLGLSVLLSVSLTAGLLLYWVASTQRISLSLPKVLASSICAVGSVGFMLGIGIFIYGMKPRLATPVMYLVVVWSFLINLVASAVKLNSVVAHSSLFYYLSFNLAKWPDWSTFSVFLLLGALFAVFGILAFARRDTVPE